MSDIIARSSNETMHHQQDSVQLSHPENANTQPTAHYREKIADHFSAEQRADTTILVSGLTMAQDRFIAAALKGLGYQVQVMDCADNTALRYGKEFGNRGQCNPTYFTVGNLVKYLSQLRDEQGLSTKEIIQNHVYVTSGACGPCRFGTYITEYRKALRDAGFEGFRVLTASQTNGVNQAFGSSDGLPMTPSLFFAGLKALVSGDVLNGLMYRIRPYEIHPGETDRVIEACRRIIEQALSRRTSLLRAAWQCRKKLAGIATDRSIAKPKVSIIGEFWAMTTEGDGNYKLQAFLESEGAEVDIQFSTAWMLYLIWSARYDLEQRATLKKADSGRRGLQGVNKLKKRLALWFAEKSLLAFFQVLANTIGLHRYHFPSMDEIARESRAFYDNDNRGGEGHMEVGKLILNARYNKVNMTLSVKPFGCMPSSGVSDGVQSKITTMYPEAIFLPIETTGDGAVNVYSRVQMQLFKARQQAQKELDAALERRNLTMENFREKISTRKTLYYPKHHAACTAANAASEI